MCVCLCVVSGFYAECPSKNMYVNGSIWTKSKFLGLSLGVHNIGSGTARACVDIDDDDVRVCMCVCSQPSSVGLW